MNKLKEIVFIIAVSCLLVITGQVCTYPHIQLKGLFDVLKRDDIGFGHVLLHSKWIENVYQYGQGKPHRKMNEGHQKWSAEFENDPVVNLVRSLWFRKNTNHSLEPMKYPSEAFDSLDPREFGTIINLTYTLAELEHVRWEKKKIDQYGTIEKNIKRINLKKLFGRLNEIRKKEEEKLPEREKEELYASDLFQAFDEHKRCFDDEGMRVSQTIKAIVKKYKGFIQDQDKQEIGRLNLSKKEEITQVQAGSKVEQLHEQAVLSLAAYINSFAKEASDKDKIDKIQRSVRERQRLHQELSSIEPPSKQAMKKSKNVIQKLETQEQELLKQVGTLRFLVKYIRAALQTYQQERYAPGMVEGILWAFFFHKIEKLSSLAEKVRAIKICFTNISDDLKNEVALESLYKAQELDKFEEDLRSSKKRINLVEKKWVYMTAEQQITKMFGNYDLMLHLLVSKLSGSFPPKISQGNNIHYEYEKGKFSKRGTADCFETAMNDLFSILWYNQSTGTYDDTLFSQDIVKNGTLRYGTKVPTPLGKLGTQQDERDHINEETLKTEEEKTGFQKLREALKYFYLADSQKIPQEEYCVGRRTSLFTLKDLGMITPKAVRELSFEDIPAKFMDRSAIKQEFMNLISGQPQIISYDSKVNGVKLFELTPGVQNFVNICNYFYGTQAKTLEDLGKEDIGISTLNRKIEFKQVGSNIQITVEDRRRGGSFEMTVYIKPGAHGSLGVPARNAVGLTLLKEDAAKNIARNINDFQYRTIFTLLTSKKLLKDRSFRWERPLLPLFYYSLDMNGAEDKCEIINNILERGRNNYEYWKGFVHNLIDSLPNDPYFKRWLSRIIVRWGFYHYDKDPFLREYIDNHVLNNQEAYADNGLVKVFEYALKHSNKFYQANNYELAKRYDHLALQIVEHPAFKHGAKIIAAALKHKCMKFAVMGFEHVSFSAKKDAVGDILSFGLKTAQVFAKNGDLQSMHQYKEMLEKVIDHATFEASIKAIEEFMVEALCDPEFKELGTKIMNNISNSWGSAVIAALSKGYKEVALQIAQHERFYVESERIGEKILKTGLRKVVACQRANDPTGQLEYKKTLLNIVKNSRFYTDGNGIVRLASHMFRKGCKDIAVAIMKKPDFCNENKRYFGRPLVSALHKADTLRKAGDHKGAQEYVKIVQDFLKDPRIKDTVKSLGFFRCVIETGYIDIALSIMEKISFGLKVNDSLVAALKQGQERSLEKEYKDFIVKLIEHPGFSFSSSSFSRVFPSRVPDFIALALCSPGYEDIAEKIMSDYRFDNWGKLLKIFLKKANDLRQLVKTKNKNDEDTQTLEHEKRLKDAQACEKMALDIVRYSRFNAAKRSMADDGLKEAFKYGYTDIILEIMKHPTFYNNRRLTEVIGYALKAKQAFQEMNDEHKACVYGDIAWRIAQNEQIDIGDSAHCALDALYEAFKTNDYNVALAIAKNKTFNADEWVVIRTLEKALEILHQAQDDRVKDVIKLIATNTKMCGGQTDGQEPNYADRVLFHLLALKNDLDIGVAVTDIIYAMVDNPVLYSNKELGNILKKVLEEGHVEVALRIVEHEKFNANKKKVIKALKCAVSKQEEFCALGKFEDARAYEIIIQKIVDHATFTISQNKVGEFLVLLKAAKKRIFELRGKFAEKKRLEREIASKKLEEQAYEKQLKEVKKRILEQREGRAKAKEKKKKCTFEQKTKSDLRRAIGLAIKEENQEAIIKLVNNSKFDNQYRLNRFKLFVMLGFKKSVLGILKNLQFNQDIKRVLEALVFIFERGNCTDVAVEFIKDSTYADEYWGDVFVKAFEVMKLIRPNEQNTCVLRVVKFHTAVMLEIIKRPVFDTRKEGIRQVLGFAKKLAKESFGRVQELQEIIGAIECK